jgi:hypothetical protein
MFIKRTMAKGHVYYQIIEGYREGERVRHRVLVSLGSTDNLAEALENMKAELTALKQERGQWPARGLPEGKLAAARVRRLDGAIARLESRVRTLRGIIQSGELGS